MFRLQTVGGFGGKSDQLNAYNTFVGDPDYFDRDLDALPGGDARVAAPGGRPLPDRPRRVALSIVPRGRDRAGDAGLERRPQVS